MAYMYIFPICLIRETDLVLRFHTDTSLYVCLIWLTCIYSLFALCETDLVLNFHTDTSSHKTMQVALNAECQYDGGHLVSVLNFVLFCFFHFSGLFVSFFI